MIIIAACIQTADKLILGLDWDGTLSDLDRVKRESDLKRENEAST